MIDSTDTKTGDLLGIEPKPAPLIKFSQDQRRGFMGFKGPRVRPGCQFCRHLVIELLNTGSQHESERVRCGLGDFPVQRGAICDDFAAG